MQKSTDRLLLCKAKLQQVGISVTELKKVRPVSQGTQMDKDLEITDVTPANVAAPQNILEIPEDETDVATKALLAEMGDLNIATTQNTPVSGQNFTVTSTAPGVPGNTANVINLLVTTQNISNYIITRSNAAGNLLVMPQNVVQQGIMPQNIIQNIVQPGTVPIQIPPGATVQDLVPVSEIPEGYKKTKFSDTLEKVDLSAPTAGQKAPKRFFCMRCMSAGVETGYTKRNYLNKHLEGCGKEKKKKRNIFANMMVVILLSLDMII